MRRIVLSMMSRVLRSFVITYSLTAGGIWATVEATSYFAGDQLKEFLGDYWIIGFLILPFCCALLVAYQTWKKEEEFDLMKAKNLINKPDSVDCIILCGGYARRLWPLTQDSSKVLLPIAGKPCLSYVLDNVRNIQNLGKILILVNQKLATQIEAFVTQYAFQEIEVIVEPHIGEIEEWGPIKALNFIITRYSPKDYLVIGGDNLFDFDLNDFLQYSWYKQATCIAIHRYESQEDVSEYGVVSISDDGIIADFKEKEELTKYREVSTACYYFRQDELLLINDFLRSGSSDDSLGTFFHWLFNQGIRFVGFKSATHWFDVGTRRRFLEANNHYLINRRDGEIGEGTTIKGPVQIESGARVAFSTIGPYVYLGNGTTVVNSEITNSVIMNNSTIRNSYINNSIVGEESTIEGQISEMVCGPHSLMLKSHDLSG